MYWTALAGYINALAVLVASICVIASFAKKPFKKTQAILQKAVKDALVRELAPINEKLDAMSTVQNAMAKDISRMNRCEIIDFMHDIQNGTHRSPEAWAYILRESKKYLDAGGNGQVEAAANYLIKEYANRKP